MKTSITINAEVRDRLMAWRETQKLKPSLMTCIEVAIDEFLEKRGAKEESINSYGALEQPNGKEK